MDCVREKLTEQQIESRLTETPDWGRDEGKWIVRRYRFPAFMDGVAFVNEVARIAEELNHHPLIAIDYRVVTLRLTSWSSGGLTELDFDSAARFDALYEGDSNN